jgi:outer membrane protein OmpA-like peptidoglycan-associated protein
MSLTISASLIPDKVKGKTIAPNYEYVMKVDRSAMAVVDSNLVVSMQLTAIQDIPFAQSVIIAPEIIDTATLRKVELPLIFINSRNQQIYFERDLKPEFPEALALQKKNGENLHISYLRTVPYEPWMENSVLKIQKKSCACKDWKNRGEEIVAAFPKEEKEPEIQLFPVYLLPPADKSVKVREEKGSAYLNFVVNKWDILPDYMNNPVELQKIHNSVNIVKNDSNVTIRKMVIEGYASPEGTNPHNIMLSERRTDALQQYLLRAGMVKGIKMEARGMGENWDGLVKELKKDNFIPQRDKLLSIATTTMDLDEKEKRMRKEAPEGYAFVLKNIYPSLRCTNYTVEYTVRPFTVEESEVVFETRPINLNLNEIYKLADKYANNETKYYSIIRKAYLLYPQDSYINLTMAYLSLKKGEADEAADYLSKVNNCPEKTMNEGLVAYLKGDVDTAIKLVEQARQQGVAEASNQLEEFKKIRKK